MEQQVRPTGRWSLTWRVAVALLGIGLLLNGTLRGSDDLWPFGPLSQYAFSPSEDDTIVITRVDGELTDGRRIDLALRPGVSGIGRAEVEARIPQITADPSLLRSVADGWMRNHPGQQLVRVWLVQDRTRLAKGRKVSTELVELATWVVPR